MKYILVLGADGYLGWPTCMYLSKKGYKVIAVDNYFKRNICKKLDLNFLYNLPSLSNRAKEWFNKTGLEIKVLIGDLQKPETLESLFKNKCKFNWSITKNFLMPEAAIHFAEQPSAPYSMIDLNSSNITLINNLKVTNNILYMIKKFNPKCHLIKLGTMGEYGTPNIDIEEGWIEIYHKKRKDRFLFPRQGNSIYHTSKIMDTDLIWFAVRNWDLSATDLMQGPVYGFETSETIIGDKLQTSFNYDEIFGTVINRFIVQSVAGIDLTVYGKGGQTRGYININDTLKCIDLALQNPPNKGNLNIYNQISETFTVNQLALMIKSASKNIGISVKIKNITNPRKEKEKHYYNPVYQNFKKLGLKSSLLNESGIIQMLELALKYKKEINKKIIFNGIKW